MIQRVLALTTLCLLAAAGRAQEPASYADDAAFKGALAAEAPRRTSVGMQFTQVPLRGCRALLLDAWWHACPKVLMLDKGETLTCKLADTEATFTDDPLASPGGELIVRAWVDSDDQSWITLAHLDPAARRLTAKAHKTAEPWAILGVSVDGKFFARRDAEGKTRYFRADPAVHQFTEIKVEGLREGETLAPLPGGRWMLAGEPGKPCLRRFEGCDETGVKFGAPFAAPWLALGHDFQDMSPGGRLAVTRSGNRMHVWRLDGEAAESSQEIEAGFEWSEARISDDALLIAHYERGIDLLRMKDGRFVADQFFEYPAEQPWRGEVSFWDEEESILLGYGTGTLMELPLSRVRSRSVRVGQDAIAWEHAPARPPATDVPNLALHAETAADVVTIRATNRGAHAALQVHGALSFAHMAGNADVELTVYFGTVAPGGQIARTIKLPFDPGKTAATISFKAEDLMLAPCTPVKLLHMPDDLKDAAAYEARARLVFDTGLAVMRELTGDQAKKVELESLGPGFGFTCNYGWDEDAPTRVGYQNPWTMWDYSLRVNRDVIQTSDAHELHVNMQMMLYWYIPHELVHAFEGGTGWEAEFIANTIQPYLTARILEKIESPFTAAFMRQVYDRYATRLRAAITDAEADAVEKYALGDGSGAPFEREAYDVFLQSTALYVYFGARINQHAWLQGHKLDELVKKYIKKG